MPWQTAWITGASSGIGRVLAQKLSADGVRVAATARSAGTLDDLTREYAGVVAVPADVTSRADMVAAHARIVDEVGPVDLAILNAGVWHPMLARDFDVLRVAQSMEVNYLGIAHALGPLIPAMVARGKGHIALVASVAGYRGLPKAAAYAPTKAAVISLAEVLRLELPAHGIVVSLVNPGFVETPMTRVNQFPMPFIMPADEAADRIVRGLRKERFEIAFPWQLVVLLKLLRVLPNGLYLRLAGRL